LKKLGRHLDKDPSKYSPKKMMDETNSWEELNVQKDREMIKMLDFPKNYVSLLEGT